MSVTKEDLREQNEKLAKVVRQLDEENSKLIDQAQANLEKKAVEVAKTLAEDAQKVGDSAVTAQAAANRAETAAAAVSVRGGLWALLLMSSAIFAFNNDYVTSKQLVIGSWSVYVLYEVVMWFWKG